AVSFFEKLQAKESAKPGTVSKMFSTHPPTGDRIEMSKKNIELVLPDKEQYVVTTSEFNQIKMQLAQLENRRPSEEANKPSLRRRTPRPDANGKDDDDNNRSTTSTSSKASSKDKQDSKADSTKPEDKEPSDDDRPKLKRRD